MAEAGDGARWVRTTSGLLKWTGLTAGGLGVLFIMLHSAANALMRTYLNSPMQGTLEWVSGWYMPIAVFLGLVVAQERDEHIDANLLLLRAPATVQRYYGVIVNVVTMVVVLAMAWFGLVEAQSQHALGTVVGISRIPQWPVMYVVPLGLTMYAVHLVLDTVRLVGRGGTAHSEISSDGNEQP